MIDTILFDLDSTLTPIPQDIFVSKYMKELAKKAIQCGYDKDKVIKGILRGCDAMLKNDGLKTNRDIFWEEFLDYCGGSAIELEPIFEKFYCEEFNYVTKYIEKERNLRPFFDYLHKREYTLILATNPLFPLVASVSRLSWVGLNIDDFLYVSTYENSTYSKPNANFFNEIFSKTGKKAENSIMVGNNAVDDMCVIEHFGMETYLVTDFLENQTNLNIDNFRHGTMDEFMKYMGYDNSLK